MSDNLHKEQSKLVERFILDTIRRPCRCEVLKKHGPPSTDTVCTRCRIIYGLRTEFPETWKDATDLYALIGPKELK